MNETKIICIFLKEILRLVRSGQTTVFCKLQAFQILQQDLVRRKMNQSFEMSKLGPSPT